MPQKRKNHGRNKKNAGHKRGVQCINCHRLVPKDKAIKRFNVRDMVDKSSQKDIREAYAFEMQTIVIPKLYYKMNYCVACAIHSRVVRVRSREDRRKRAPPKRNFGPRPGQAGQAGQAKQPGQQAVKA